MAGGRYEVLAAQHHGTEIEAVADCLRAGHLATGVPIQGFEQKSQESFGYEHVAAVSSGTALTLALKRLAEHRGGGADVNLSWPPRSRRKARRSRAAGMTVRRRSIAVAAVAAGAAIPRAIRALRASALTTIAAAAALVAAMTVADRPGRLVW